MSTPRSYDVGYRKPPKKTQFKPGQSGNPKGRPKGTKNLSTDLTEELAEKIPVTERGRKREITKQRAMVKALMAKAVQGDTKAANTLLNMFLKLIPREAEPAAEIVDYTETDLAVLEDFLTNAKKSKGQNNG